MKRPVVLWLQQAFRLRDNPALARALQLARREGGGLVVLHGLDAAHPLGSPRVNRVLMEGALETLAALEARGALARHITATRARPLWQQVVDYGREARAAAIVADDPVAYVGAANLRAAGDAVEAVEANVIVPTRAYGKAAVSAAAVRGHLQREAAARLREAEPRVPARIETDAPEPPGAPVEKCDADMHAEGTWHPQAWALHGRGGERVAESALARFVARGLGRYGERGELRRSGHHAALSTALHFGCLSPRVAMKAAIHSEAFVEQVLVRRELAFNAARYLDLRSLASLPPWARATLAQHDADRREHVYTQRELDEARTHDELWNAAQTELRETGLVHSYLRMYWAKKIVEWTPSHEDARGIMERLNGAWGLDGRGPTMWTGHLWTFGLHDRPFAERPIFGKVRWMSAEGTRKKFDVAAYITWTKAACPSG